MIKLIFVPLCIGLLACTTVKTTLKQTNPMEVNSNVFKVHSPCPIEGDCKVSRLPNTALLITDVEVGTKGSVSYELVDSPGTEVVMYTYEKATDSALMDGFYKEEIIFEIPSEKQRLSLENRDLQDVKMLFGRFCYCKGQNGYFKVKRGKLNLSSSAKKVQATLNFKVLEIPQLLENISFTVN